ncbi:MAG TPA: BatD family protein [Verrucomicrobiae bacterium]
MRFTLKTLALLLAVALLARTAGAATFTASLDRDSMVLGESATLTLRFDGEVPQADPLLPEIPGLNIGSAVKNFIDININGVPSSILTYTFSVTPQRVGEFAIPALTADVNGQSLASAPLKLTVTAASAPSAAAVNSGNEVAFLKFIFQKNKVYVGEPEVGRLELYLRDDVSSLNGFQLTGSPTDGFSAGKLIELQNQRRRVQVGNRVYTVIPLAIPLTAVRAGWLVLGPFTAGVGVVLPSANRGGNPFFMFNQGEQKQVTLATDPFNVESLPLPDENRPANFTGAVGNFSMTATAGPTTVTVGDPITVRVQISGRGALDSITLPAQDTWQNFKTYPPTSKVELSDQFGFQGAKTFEQIISPLNNDVHELPPLTFTFFNPDDGRYHTLTHAAVPLVVHAAGASPLPAMAANKNSAPENQSPQDVLPIKQELGALVAGSAPLVTHPLFLAVQSVPVLAFIGAFIWRKRTDNLANNPRLRRQRAVAQLVASGMGDLKKYAAANQPDEFFATLFRLLQEQLGERLDCPASAITENVIEEHPVLRGASKTTLDGLRGQFQLCNQARYAPVRGAAELNSVAAQFEKTIGELQNLKT